jgi:L-ascorbate metabolism protein UlaG (beta-lactamase superfamily)
MKTSFGKKATGERLERMKASPRWVDGSFQNIHPVLPHLKGGEPMPSLTDFLCGGGRRTPSAPLPALDPREGWAKRAETGLRATWLGHSTVLIELDGRRILTDPVWGERASPLSIAGPKRFQPVPIAISALPPLDLVLISHDHYDHLDYPTILELARLDVPFVTSLGVGAHLESWGVPSERITELDWWETFTLPGGELSVTAAPSQHFSGRGVGGRNATLWSSFAVQSAKHRFFFSGDTGLTTEYQTIRERLGPFDLVLLEVGAFHPAWGDIHLGPRHALEALDLLGGGHFLPVHWGTFNLAIHAWDEPAETLLALAPEHQAKLVMPRIGEAVEPARVERVDTWWRPTAELDKHGSQPSRVEEAAPPGVDQAIQWPID